MILPPLVFPGYLVVDVDAAVVVAQEVVVFDPAFGPRQRAQLDCRPELESMVKNFFLSSSMIVLSK